ncbi:N-acetyltransferase GCN5 [Tolypothrix sp. NIES-4075]|uniref:GNAT family N-acetyltransferase n=1 Tax=Tolypothrix sp. NIES-4075 TaxID=2005459 RepID=UPI000B70AD17|nr:GNAT family N-acetyltransferase [Tolypothrix sp. NIES-4075]GAX41359.1 N-acetyltransferase GCN5 [Tolypothrix sp. NIES-4075]
MINALKIRQMTPKDVQLALNWAAAEGWNPGINDAIAFHATDPTGFLIGEVNNEPIACISAVCYDATFGFIGLYIVKNKWRQQGYGTQIWQAAWQQLNLRLEENKRSVALDAVVEREATYRKIGFTPAYRNISHVYETTNSHVPTDVVPLVDVPLTEVIRYDAELFGVSRPQFLQPWINVQQGAAYGVVEAGKLKGYGVIRPCHQGFKIGPLFADNREIAECLFEALTSHAALEPVFIDIPDANSAIASFTRRYNLQQSFTYIRMYCYRTLITDLNRIFGATTLSLG